MGFYVQVEATQPVTAERVGPALEDDGGGSVCLYRWSYHVFEQFYILFILHPIMKRDVQAMVPSRVRRIRRASRIEGPSAGKVDFLVVFVEGDGHYPIRGPESLFDAIAVVNVYVDVQHSRMVEE